MKQQLAQQQIAQGAMTAQQAQELKAMYDLHAATKDPSERARIADAIRLRTNKDKPDRFAPMVLAGAKTMDGTEAERGYSLDRQTGEIRAVSTAGQTDMMSTPEASKIRADYQAKKITREQANAMLAKLEGR